MKLVKEVTNKRERRALEFQKTQGYSKYKEIHRWVKKQIGKPQNCAHCGKTNVLLDLALLQGKNYEKKIENFVYLCRFCHRAYDKIHNPVLQFSKDGVLIKEHQSVVLAAKDVKATNAKIYAVLSGKQKTCMGFNWEYKYGRMVGPESFKREKRMITYNGVTKSMDEWSAFLGGRPDLVKDRIHGRGWSEEKAVSTPYSKRAPRTEGNWRNISSSSITHNGVTLNISEWGLRLGGDKTLIYDRLNSGWSIEKAVSTPARPKKKQILNTT